MVFVVEQKKEKHWIKYIKQRIRQNKNMLMFIGGPTGSGKSYCSLRIAEELDPKFGIDRVVFTGLELMDLVNNGNLKSGSVIVFEEAGIEMSNRAWQSSINKMLNFLIQTFRHRNFILIFNSPYMDFVDASTRKLFHAELQTLSIDSKKAEVLLKPQLLQYNSRIPKMYYKYLRVMTKEHGAVPIKRWRVGKPSSELLEFYEKRKRKFTDDLNKEIQTGLKSAKKKEKKKPKMVCMKCGYKWRPRSKEPKRCPKCQKNPW